jgi:hypothetical protein
MPDLVKVGKTTGDTDVRASALSGATGVAVPFEIFKSYTVSDCDAAEKLAHRVLEAAVGRPNSRREFFHGPADLVGSILDDALAPYFENASGEAALRLFEEAYKRFSRKEYTMACLEFEAAFPRVGSTPMTYIMSKGLLAALGTYLAACASVNRAPAMQHCIFDPMLKSRVMERAIEAMKGSSTDPAAELLAYMGRIS